MPSAKHSYAYVLDFFTFCHHISPRCALGPVSEATEHASQVYLCPLIAFSASYCILDRCWFMIVQQLHLMQLASCYKDSILTGHRPCLSVTWTCLCPYNIVTLKYISVIQLQELCWLAYHLKNACKRYSNTHNTPTS